MDVDCVMEEIQCSFERKVYKILILLFCEKIEKLILYKLYLAVDSFTKMNIIITNRTQHPTRLSTMRTMLGLLIYE